jgi:hypothetical protein
MGQNPATTITLESHHMSLLKLWLSITANLGAGTNHTHKNPLSLVTQSNSMKDLTCLQKVASQV